MTEDIIEVDGGQQPVGNRFDIDAFLQMRQEFIEKVSRICVEGKDYHIIQGRKSLAKGGAEKIASIFGWSAEFEKDADTYEMLGKTEGLVTYVCRLKKNGQEVGQGRGAATLSRNSSDPNKTIKMAEKSAFIDAVLRASGLSDFFTQDLGPEDEGSTFGHVSTKASAGEKPSTGPAASVYLASPAQKDLIRKLMDEKGVAKLSDIGFQHKEVTKEYASEIIDYLLKYNRSASDAAGPEGVEITVDDMPQ